MASAEIKEVLPVDFDVLFDVIVKYEAYPQFIDGCTQVQVERTPGTPGQPGRAKASYKVNMIKEVNYTLDHVEDREKGTIEWSLVDSDFFKSNRGSWKLKRLGPGKTEAHYALEADFKIPVPGMILNRLIKGSLPQMLKNFEKQCKRQKA